MTSGDTAAWWPALLRRDKKVSAEEQWYTACPLMDFIYYVYEMVVQLLKPVASY